MMTTTSIDPHTHLRSLYASLLQSQEHFDEFKRLLQLYTGPAEGQAIAEPPEAMETRRRLNARISEWTGHPSDFSAMQVLQFRMIIVEERINVAISPWKEANGY